MNFNTRPTFVALVCWQVYNKVSERPRIDIGWPDYVKSGTKTLYIGKR
jgi:hypothetical protein